MFGMRAHPSSGTLVLSVSWLDIVPVAAKFNLDLNRHSQDQRIPHRAADKFRHEVNLVVWRLQHQFVMHLQNLPGSEAQLVHLLLKGDHSQLDHVGSGALNGSIDSIAFGTAADGIVG